MAKKVAKRAKPAAAKAKGSAKRPSPAKAKTLIKKAAAKAKPMARKAAKVARAAAKPATNKAKAAVKSGAKKAVREIAKAAKSVAKAAAKPHAARRAGEQVRRKVIEGGQAIGEKANTFAESVTTGVAMTAGVVVGIVESVMPDRHNGAPATQPASPAGVLPPVEGGMGEHESNADAGDDDEEGDGDEFAEIE